MRNWVQFVAIAALLVSIISTAICFAILDSGPRVTKETRPPTPTPPRDARPAAPPPAPSLAKNPSRLPVEKERTRFVEPSVRHRFKEGDQVRLKDKDGGPGVWVYHDIQAFLERDHNRAFVAPTDTNARVTGLYSFYGLVEIRVPTSFTSAQRGWLRPADLLYLDKKGVWRR